MNQGDIFSPATMLGLPLETLVMFAGMTTPKTPNSDTNLGDLIPLSRTVLETTRYSELLEWVENVYGQDYSAYPRSWVMKTLGFTK